jgi:hypothetical protein
VAQVWQNRQEAGIVGGWFGDADPDPADTQVALSYTAWPDYTEGALYALGPGDAARLPWLKRLVHRYECAGTYVEIWQ